MGAELNLLSTAIAEPGIVKPMLAGQLDDVSRAGNATFNNLIIIAPPGNYTLSFSLLDLGHEERQVDCFCCPFLADVGFHRNCITCMDLKALLVYLARCIP